MEHERFTELVTPHIGAMARTAAALVGLADAEDAAQEALVRAWNSWASLREEYAVSAWLLRIAVNVCHNWQGGRFGTRQRLTSMGCSGTSQEHCMRLRYSSRRGRPFRPRQTLSGKSRRRM